MVVTGNRVVEPAKFAQRFAALVEEDGTIGLNGDGLVVASGRGIEILQQQSLHAKSIPLDSLCSRLLSWPIRGKAGVVAILRDKIVDLAFERGLLILGCGETSIRLCPPLIVKQEETEIALDILEECIQLAAK